jgi:hypothetical protein
LRLAKGEKEQEGKEADASPWTDQEDADASTDAGASSLEVGSQVDSQADKCDMESVLNVLTGGHSGNQAFRVSSSPASSVASTQESPTEGSSTSTSLRSRLNTRARAWAPSAPSAAALNDTPEVRYFKQELKQIVAAARAALVSCMYIVGVHVEDEGAKGASVVVRLSPYHVQYTESVLSLAKQALLESVTKSQQSVLLGYGARPFLPMPGGFSAIFCLVPDKQVACWGLLKKGACHFGTQCRWKHPVCQAAVHVKVLLEEQPLIAPPPPRPPQ